MPHLLLRDLIMPSVDGREVLRAMRADPALRCIPVAALTTSESQEDMATVYDLGASSYLTKPQGLDDLVSSSASC